MAKDDTVAERNMALWKDVCTTNPLFTKEIEGGTLTAINPYWQIQRATEMFGPCGIGWGYKIVDEKYIDGAPIFIGQSQVVLEKIHVLRIQVWYQFDGKKGEVEHFGETKMVYLVNGAYYSDEDAPKKSLTDALSKCLSMLGFSADVYLNFMNDPKYKKAVGATFKSEPGIQPQTPESAAPATVEAQVQQQVAKVENTAVAIIQAESAPLPAPSVPPAGIDESEFSAIGKQLLRKVRAITNPADIPAARVSGNRLSGIERTKFFEELKKIEESLGVDQHLEICSHD